MLVATAGALFVAPPAGASTVGTSSFRVTFDAQLAGAVWALTTQHAAAPTGNVTLAAGTVPGDGVVSVTVPSAALTQADTGQFAVRAASLLSTAEAAYAVRTVGVPVERLGADLDLDLGAAATHTVTTYPTAVQAAAAAVCGSTCTADGTVPTRPAVSAQRRHSAPSRLAPGTAHNPTSGTSAGSSASAALDTLGCVSDNTCGVPTTVTVRNPGECSGSFVMTCTLDAADITGVSAFRGWSERDGGMTDSFSVEVGTQQKWDNGLRLKAGPFEVSGHTTRTVGSGGADTWPLRGDCWTQAGYDQPPCSSVSHQSKWGRDTWRWEKNLITVCSGTFVPSCNSWTEEDLYEKTFDGGTEDGNIDTVNDHAQPSAISGGQKGSWASYLPGSSRTTWMDNKVSYGGSASVSVNFPDSFGGATFTSSMEHENLSKVTNAYQFRSGLPWFTQAPGWPTSTGKWYRYDMGSSWRYEYFSCQWAQGWTGGSCWDFGA